MSGNPDQGDDANQHDANQDSQPLREPAVGEQVAVLTVNKQSKPKNSANGTWQEGTSALRIIFFLWRKVSKEQLIFTDVIAFK